MRVLAHRRARLIDDPAPSRHRHRRGAVLAGSVAFVAAVGALAWAVPGGASDSGGRAPATGARALSGAGALGGTATRRDPASNLAYTFSGPLDAVNAGRAAEGIGPLPTGGLGALTTAQEVFVIVDLERAARGLVPFEAMTQSLDALSQAGANAGQDPAPPGPTSAPLEYGSIESGVSDPLMADFGWMYEDGCDTVSPQVFVNRDCVTSPAAGWGHRHDILENFASGPGCHLVMGAAVGQGTSSLAATFEGYCGAPAPDDVVFTWHQAQVIVAQSAADTSCHAPSYPRGYRLAASDGGVFSYGDLPFCGSVGASRLVAPVVGMASTPGGGGYWLAASDGGVFAFGDAAFYGSMAGTPLDRPIVAIAAAPFGNGYWLVAADGGIFAFGSAHFYGSTGGTALVAPIVGIAVSPFGLGYWLVGADGGVFSFGGARFFGSTGGTPLDQPVVGLAASPFGSGYWLVAADGGVFAFGSARFYGSMGGAPLSRPIVAMAPAPFGLGYWLVAADGGVFAFGDGAFYGSTGGISLTAPVVGVAA